MQKTAIVAGMAAAAALLGTTPAVAASTPTWSVNNVAVTVRHGQWNGAPGCIYNVKVNFNHGKDELRIYRWRPGDKLASDSNHVNFPRAGKNTVWTFHMGANNGDRVYFQLYLQVTRASGPPVVKVHRLVDHDRNPRTITPWACHA
jgi:hypothetical protein